MNQQISTLIVTLAGMLLVTGCGGGTPQGKANNGDPSSGNSAEPSPTFAVELLPESPTIVAGQQISFISPFIGNVTWKVNNVLGGDGVHGSIDAAGIYTAPAAAPSDPVTVTAQFGNTDFSPSASASVTVLNSGTVAGTSNALVAAYRIAAPDKSTVTVSFGPDITYGLQTAAVTGPVGGGPVRVIVAGMRPSSTYHMRAAITLADGNTIYDSDHLFTTSALPSGIAFPTVTTQRFGGRIPNSGIELLSLANSTSIALAATDISGNYIWYYDSPGLINQPAKLLPNGHFLTQFDDGVADGSGSIVREIDLEGNTIWQMSAADLNNALSAAGFPMTVIGTHHDFVVLPNGHTILLAAATKDFDDLVGLPGTTTVTGDVVIDLDQKHKPVWVWSAFDHLDVNRHLLLFPDWTHANAILYSPTDGNLVVSLRHQSWIIKIDYRDGLGSGNILWRLGWQGDFQLIGATDPVDWFFAQHAPHFVSLDTAGVFDLLLFDNGNNRLLDSAGDICGTAVACETTIPLIHVNEQQKTATIVWRDRLGIFSNFGGYVQNLENSDIEFAESAPNRPTTSSTVQEVTIGSPPQPVWQMQIDGSFAYRALRIPSLYPGVTWP